MAVFRVERTRDYTVMSNYHLKDTGLTLKAKGLLSMMLSLPDEWNYTTRGLASICKESVETIGKTLRELESAGYLTRRQLRGKNGRITDTEYTIFEKPVKPQPEPAPPDTASPGTENPDMVNPDMETPDMAVPDTENPPQLNTKKSNIQKSNTHGSNTHSFFPSAPAAAETDGQTEVMEKREEIRDQIEYEHICNSLNREQIDEFVEIMLEVALTKSPTIKIGRDAEYPHSAAYASEHGEMAQYNASFQASHACKEAIEQAVSRHYRNNRLDAEAAVNDVLERFGPDRVQYVLANTVRHKEWDGRISRDNKAWASTMPMPEGGPQDRHSEYLVVDRCNPGLTDLFVKQVRQLAGEREKPSVREKLQKAPAAPRRSASARKKEAER